MCRRFDSVPGHQFSPDVQGDVLSQIKVITQNQFVRTPWKNGLGFTDQIAIHPSSATLERADFIWRLSSAKVDRASQFSFFPGFDRTLVVLDGEGLRLFSKSADAAVSAGPMSQEKNFELRRHGVLQFSGDDEMRCELIAGPVRDFNIFVRRGQATANVRVIKLAEESKFEWRPQGRWNFAFAIDNKFAVEREGEAKLNVGAGDCLSIEVTAAAKEAFSQNQVMSLRANTSLSSVVLVELYDVSHHEK